MEVKNYRSSVSYSLVCYKEDGSVESEINYKVTKSDNRIIMSWIEFFENSAMIGDVYVLREPTPILENGELTYDIAFAKRKYTVKVRYLDDRLLKDVDETGFFEQLTADLFEQSIRKLAENAVCLPVREQLSDDTIMLLVKSHRN